jgi:hypothetical protein
MKDQKLKLTAVIALVAALMAAAVRVQAVRERDYPPPAEEDAALYVTSPGAARRLALAYPTLAADLYWIRAIQYYGGTKRHLEEEYPFLAPPPILARDPAAGYPLLFPLLDLTTSLDPWFNVAYRFGAIFLAEPYPKGPGRPDLAVALLEKGLRNRPDKWEYMQDIGFVHYWYTHEYGPAAEWFGKPTRVPGAPWWLKSLAATTLAQGGDRQSSRQMWMAIRESAEIDWLKQDAERRLLQLRALDEIDELQRRADRFLKQSGRPFTDWHDLARAGVVPGVMVDPTGTAYEIDPEGRVRLSQRSPLWPPPEEPQTIPGRPSA